MIWGGEKAMSLGLGKTNLEGREKCRKGGVLGVVLALGVGNWGSGVFLALRDGR